MTTKERARWSAASKSETEREVAWLEDMLAYCANMLSQLGDLTIGCLEDDDRGFVDYPCTTGPDDNPDEYDVHSLLHEIRRKRPNY